MSAAFNRRMIPAEAVEGSWTARDGQMLRRIDWAPNQPRGSILFLTGRGDFYEKYLEAMAHWHSLGRSLVAI